MEWSSKQKGETKGNQENKQSLKMAGKVWALGGYNSQPFNLRT
jgi:hypothetical protein